MNRRTFMQKTGLIMSGLTLSPLIGKSYSSIYGQTAPSNKVKVALIGCRSMGYGDLNNFSLIIRRRNAWLFAMSMTNG